MFKGRWVRGKSGIPASESWPNGQTTRHPRRRAGMARPDADRDAWFHDAAVANKGKVQSSPKDRPRPEEGRISIFWPRRRAGFHVTTKLPRWMLLGDRGHHCPGIVSAPSKPVWQGRNSSLLQRAFRINDVPTLGGEVQGRIREPYRYTLTAFPSPSRDTKVEAKTTLEIPGDPLRGSSIPVARQGSDGSRRQVKDKASVPGQVARIKQGNPKKIVRLSYARLECGG
jgi:hypothetical protein